MKLEDLLKQLNELVEQDPAFLKDDVVLSVEHTRADDCDDVRVGYSDNYPSNWLIKYKEVDDWMVEMGYKDIAEAIKDSNLRRTIMLL